MDEPGDLQIWDPVSVSVVGMRHRLLLAQSAAELFESSSFIFCMGKSGEVLIDGLPYRFSGHLLMHVPPDKTVIIDPTSRRAGRYRMDGAKRRLTRN